MTGVAPSSKGPARRRIREGCPPGAHSSPSTYATLVITARAVGRPGEVLKPPQISPQQRLYSPGVPSARAVISYDEGRTWEDEAYYVYFGPIESGYNQSVALKDGTILTIASLDYKENMAIRWKPIKKKSSNP